MTVYYYPSGVSAMQDGTITLYGVSQTGGITFSISGFSNTYNADFPSGQTMYTIISCSTSKSSIQTLTNLAWHLKQACTSKSQCTSYVNSTRNILPSYLTWGTTYYIQLGQYNPTNGYAALGKTLTVYYGDPAPTISIAGSLSGRVFTLTPTYTSTTGMVWQISNDGSTWTQFSTALGTVSYTFGSSMSGTYYFRCIATGGGGTTTSNTVSVNVPAVESSMSVHDSTLRDKSCRYCQSMPTVTNHDMSLLG